ncbi:hypothetical protein [Dactylosporangium sp. CA-233914]|uniref:hypothetical protein n=1 Tax=Dactylosporangium sp. CA-233914 TaxID=3239934 RepID=UPI003D8B799C
MQELHVTIDPDGADLAVQRLQEPLEAQLTSALQRAADTRSPATTTASPWTR